MKYWQEQEEKISKALGTIRNTLTIGSVPSVVAKLGYLGSIGGWVVAEDGAALRQGTKEW